MIRATGRTRKHAALLVAIVALLVAQPLLGHKSVELGALFDAAVAAICLYVFVIVFAERWQRRTGLALFLPVLAGNCALYLLPPQARIPSAIVYHCFLVVFVGFTVAVILRDIFRKRAISGDEVLGAFCGYLLAGVAWANLYAMTYLLVPGAFSVKPELAWRLGAWHLQRALFDYLSFTTLTSLGYSDISPAGPPAYSLTWLEVLFGQFYMAVVVAQLVGLKLAEALKGDAPGAR
jgi:voltage-gated potassium channel